MKRLLITSALALSLAGGAAVAQDASQLRNAVGNYIATTEYNVDVSTLTDEQVAQLYSAITSTDDHGERDNKVRAVLSENNVETYERPTTVLIADIEYPRDQIFTSVQNALVGTEYEGLAWTLSDEELVEVYSLLNNAEADAPAITDLQAYFE